MDYTLYNSKEKKLLTHPRIGVWYTSDLQEAKEMLDACREYVRSCGRDESDFKVVELETKNEVYY